MQINCIDMLKKKQRTNYIIKFRCLFGYYSVSVNQISLTKSLLTKSTSFIIVLSYWPMLDSAMTERFPLMLSNDVLKSKRVKA